MRDDVAEGLLGLFTTSDRALAIAGDLAQERGERGCVRYWFDVASVTLALWRSIATEAPLRVFGLMLAGLALITPSAAGGIAATFLVPHWIKSPLGWVGLPLFWWGGALLTGACLVVLAPRRGMAACAMLAAGGEALLIGFGASVVWREPSNTAAVVFCTTGLLAAMPLLTGAVVARRLLLRSAAHGQARPQ